MKGSPMRLKHFLFPAVFALVLLPMFVGFSGPEARQGDWERVGNHYARLMRAVFTLRPAMAEDERGPGAAYRNALKLVQREFHGATIDRAKTKELTFAAIHGMLHALNDPHTSFLEPKAWQQMRQNTSGSFEGIGAKLEEIGKQIRVFSPIPDSPAYHAGIKTGDIIVSVGTHDTKTGKLLKTTSVRGMDIDDVVRLIKGPRGTKVTVSMARKGVPEPISFTMIRAHVTPPLVTAWMEDPANKIGHIALSDFYETSPAQIDLAIADLRRQGMKALIFDLRNNRGGLLDVAIDVTSRFVDPGDVVTIVQEKNGRRHGLRASSAGQRSVRLPLVVLINEESASASEIFAGAIQDHGVGTLVGQHTYGKGLVQTLLDVGDGAALKVTTAKYFTPSGRDINNKYDEEHRPIEGTGGVKPDFEVKQPDAWTDVEDKENDAQLKRALEILRQRLAQAPVGGARLP